MNAATPSENDGSISSSMLLVIAFATAFFPRILNAIGLPAGINFLHFFVVPIACIAVIAKAKFRSQSRLAIVRSLLMAMLLLLGVMVASALLTGAGAVNVALDFLLLTESYWMLLAIVCIPFTQKRLQQFRQWILAFGLIHLLLALGQKVLLSAGFLYEGKMTIEDNIQGVFYLSGGGHVVAASVSMAFGLYYFVSAKAVSIWIRSGLVFAAVMQLLFADAKQVLLVCLLAWFLLILVRVSDIQATLQYTLTAIVVVYVLLWCMQNLEIFQAYNTWIRPEIYGPDGDATVLKLGPFWIISSFYESPLNWLFGLGPGHTIGRLGGWMMKDYWNLLGPLGGTVHPASQAVWATWRGYYLDSSFFSPFWGWAAIWGDLGIVGLVAYGNVVAVIWRQICPDDFSKFTFLTIIINGFIFTLMEEPGFMLTMMILIGLRWHEQHLLLRRRRSIAALSSSYPEQFELN